MASKGNPPYNPNTTPKYMLDFSKALAGEVRILLQEVGKLRDERRALQFEIAELMALKSKHGAGGEYQPDWRPQAIEAPPPEALMPPPPPPAIEDIPPARPGWRTVPKKVERRPRKIMAPPAAAPPPPPPQPMYDPPPNVPAWAQWRPNPLLAPTPMSHGQLSPSPPPRQGLFGATTPPPGGR